MADLLAGSWRPSPPPLEISEGSIQSLRSAILFSGSGGLVWWKLRNSGLKSSPALDPIHDAFRLYSARAAVHEHHLNVLLPYFRKAGIEPILAKGWAVARLYPQPGLRPYGDFDICVPPSRMREAQHVLDSEPMTGIDIDFHERFRELESDYDALLERSVRIPIGKSHIRVLRPEDHLRLLSIHMLYHGGWKPAWVCDVALMMETAGADFEWKQFADDHRKNSEWVLAALALAHRVLGAKMPEAIGETGLPKFPQWLFDALLEQWGQIGHYMHGPSAADMLREGHLMEALRSRWPNRLQATVRMGARVNSMPRLPLQVADVIKRAAKLHRGKKDAG
jgi:Uncharacterised nucleotidyltransferase